MRAEVQYGLTVLRNILVVLADPTQDGMGDHWTSSRCNPQKSAHVMSVTTLLNAGYGSVVVDESNSGYFAFG